MAGIFTTTKYPRVDHYNDVALLGPPTMRGAIVFSGSSHPKLAEGVCDRLGMKPGSATLSKFKNGETSVTIRMLRPAAAAASIAF
jgi:ribose-phosphate pyrophosphokinase